MIRNEFFDLLSRRNQIYPQDHTVLFSKLHELYSNGESITVDNMSKEEKDIARMIDAYYNTMIPPDFLDHAINSGQTKNIFDGMVLYRVELVPILKCFSYDSNYATEATRIQLLLEKFLVTFVLDERNANLLNTIEIDEWNQLSIRLNPNSLLGISTEYRLED